MLYEETNPAHRLRVEHNKSTLLIQVANAQSNFAFWEVHIAGLAGLANASSKIFWNRDPHDILNVRYHPKRIAQRPRKKLSKALDEWDEQLAQLNDFIRAQQQRL